MAEVRINIDKNRLADLLCSAFEGGSNYWYMIERQIKPPALEFLSDAASATNGGREPHAYPHLDYPLNPGGALVISAHGDSRHEEVHGKKKWTLDLEACERGLQVMAEKYPKHFADFQGENDDAITGDVYLQCCLFGEVVYG